MLGESIPTKFVFFDAKYLAAEDERPGFSAKKFLRFRLLFQPVKKTTVDLCGIIPFLFSNCKISFFVIA
jgi:hypothetical protein